MIREIIEVEVSNIDVDTRYYSFDYQVKRNQKGVSIMKIFWIDLFAGAGGTTTGIHLTSNTDVSVVACKLAESNYKSLKTLKIKYFLNYGK